MSEITITRALKALRDHGVTDHRDVAAFVDECWDIYAIDRTAEGDPRVIDASEMYAWLKEFSGLMETT